MAQPTEDLTSFVAKMGGDKALRIEENLGQGFVRLRVSEAQRRQAAQDIRCIEDAVIELLRNARDAGARHIFLATTREGQRRTVTILDDGSGIPRNLWEAIFDPRVTSKLESVIPDRWGVHGRGMALYSIRENTLESHVMDSIIAGGTSLRIVSDLDRLSEKADQSTWPTIGRDDDGSLCVERGPHNIIRTCCEFALDHRSSCEVFLGSPAEMVATARARIRTGMSIADGMFLESLSELPVLERFRLFADAKELTEISQALGLDISERTAHRIISGQIKPVRTVLSRITHNTSERKPRKVDLEADRRGLRLSPKDTNQFLHLMERDFEYLADRYFLTLSSRPQVRVTGKKLTVTFEYEGED